MVTETVAIAKRVFSGSIPQLRSDRVSLCLPGNGATSCQPGATRQEAAADALSSVQSAPYETTGTVAVQPSPVESVNALEAAANTVANLDSQVGLPSKARFWPISALGERQFRVDLHLSGLASGLVTSDASDWSSRMQMGGQLRSLADMAMEVLNVFTQRAIYSHAASIHPILLIIRCRPITCLV